MTEVRTVLFDFGGVIIRTPFELQDADWRGPFDPSADALWQESQRGEITEREYWHRRSAALYPDEPDPTYAYMRALYDQPEETIVRPELVELLDELDARGLRAAVLTNDLSKFHPPEWIERMTVTKRFDPLIDLSHAPVLKPSAEAFTYALGELGQPPGEVLFVDDQRPNVVAADDAGLRTVWFDPTQVDDSLTHVRASLGG